MFYNIVYSMIQAIQHLFYSMSYWVVYVQLQHTTYGWHIRLRFITCSVNILTIVMMPEDNYTILVMHTTVHLPHVVAIVRITLVFPSYWIAVSSIHFEEFFSIVKRNIKVFE